MLKENVKICYYKIKKNTGHSSSLSRTLKKPIHPVMCSLSLLSLCQGTPLCLTSLTLHGQNCDFCFRHWHYSLGKDE